jgi:hypothetical protein
VKRRALITLSTGTDESTPVHSRGWEVPADDAHMEQFAEILTNHFGAPTEWVTDDADTPGKMNVLYYRE